MLDYEDISKKLDIHREVSDDLNFHQLRRLRMTPFSHSKQLFNSIKSFPCWELAPNFVLKIVDELIYCGLNPKK